MSRTRSSNKSLHGRRRRRFICPYNSHNITSIIIHPKITQTVTNSNNIGKNGIPKAELIAGSGTGK